MGKRISRRDFFKISGLGAAATAVLTGCGPASRYVTRQQYAEMPEYNITGISTYYASSCQECAAGCGIIVRTQEGRAITIQGNPNHPINHGNLCSRGLTAVQGLYNPDRVTGPQHRNQRGREESSSIDWDTAIQVVTDSLQNNDPSRVAFLLGLAPDHLYDLVSEISDTTGAKRPYRYGALGMFEARATLIEGVHRIFGEEKFPFFDIAQSDMVFSFGANFLETWLSPLTYSRAYGNMRQGRLTRRGYLVSFEPRQSVTSGNADEWVPVVPGTERLVALGLGKLIAQMKQSEAPYFSEVDLDMVVETSGVSREKLDHLAELFSQAESPLALPGGSALTHEGGLATAQSILALNVLGDNLGKPGGLFLTPSDSLSNSYAELQDLIDEMNQGEIDVVFIHGWNPVFELPEASGFVEALSNVGTVISFDTFPNETTLYCDYVLPDHSALESWGYQRTLAGADRRILSSFQPVVTPLYDTRSTVDVLLAAASQMGGGIQQNINYADEVEFIQQKILPYLQEGGGFYTAPELPSFWAKMLQYGGWWQENPDLTEPEDEGVLSFPYFLPEVNTPGNGEFYFIAYPTQLGDGRHANKPWIQETPDPMTTVMWNSWIEIHPETAARLGIHNDDIVEITSSAGTIEAIVYLYPAIRPDTVAMPFGQGHTHFSRFADQRGSNPAIILPVNVNEAGDLTVGDTFVTIQSTGRRRPLARYEDRHGVYGDHEE